MLCTWYMCACTWQQVLDKTPERGTVFMAKVRLIVTCSECGEKFIFTDKCRNIEEARKREEWAKTAVDLCPKCYARSIDANKEFSFGFTPLPYVDPDDGSIMVSIWFEGDTKPHKDEIKALGGYLWGERRTAQDAFSLAKPPLCWSKVIKLDELSEEIEKARSVGATQIVPEDNLFAMAHFKIAQIEQEKWREKHRQIAAIKKPEAPDVLKGHRWNQKIYGRAGSYSVYLDGKRENLTDDEAKKIEAYLQEKEEYRAKIKAIK